LASHIEGTRNMLAASTGAGVRRFVYTSSVAALGIPDHAPASSDHGIQPLDETHEWRGNPSRWAYGYAKHQAEQLVRRAGQQAMEAILLNPALVIGPGDRHRVSNGLIWHMLHGRVPPLVPGGLNVVDVRDVTDGFLAALDRGRSGERYILSGENRTLSDLIQATAQVLGLRPPRLKIPLRAARTAGGLAAGLGTILGLPVTLDLLRMAGLYFYYDGTKAQRELGLGPPRAYAPAAMASAEWYRQRMASGHRDQPL
jgi:dihydroflavonol-4-reductase